MKCLVSLSGGVDSCAALARVVSLRPDEIYTVGFNYGSKHNQYENAAAAKIADHYSLPFHLVDMTGVMKGFCSHLMKGQGDIPEGHYNSPTMSQTVVPGRNLIFVSILAGLAESQGLDVVVLGIHAGDHHIYPDCRPEFFVAANETVKASSDGKVFLQAPFIHVTKIGVVERGLRYQAPFHLTRTCYKDQEIACGKCGSCQERLEAFAKNGVSDPIEYEGG